VLNQDPPGTDWIKDHWQAASDMHGTAIKGVHWITMQFASPITVSYIELDPEAALSKDYRIKVSSSNQNEWISMFDTNQGTYESHEYGQSPEVTTKIPLHVSHNISIPIEAPRPLTSNTNMDSKRCSRMGSFHYGNLIDVHGWYEP
jgi:hypothetical protein